MTVRVATCRCEQLRATCMGDPTRISVCHCLGCQKRSGSAFAVQARWPDDRVTMAGEFRLWSRLNESGSTSTYRFCPVCGATVAFFSDRMPGVTAIAVGAFAEPGFPAPRFSIFEQRKHGWVVMSGDEIEHRD
jgi:hypothetical protein